MLTACRRSRLGALAAIPFSLVAIPSFAQNTEQALMHRVQALEQRVQELEVERARVGGAAVGRTANISPEALQALLDRVDTLESRLGDIETSAVLSEPETRVKRVEVYVDNSGNEYDQPTAGARKAVTYRRERVLRRPDDQRENRGSALGRSRKASGDWVDAATVTQFADQSTGADTDADRHASTPDAAGRSQ